MKSSDVRSKYLEFFKNKGHQIIPSSSLVPENDPTTLFTSAGMQPMIPYLLGEKHPEGTRIVDSQKCFRSNDIEEVGDNRHTTLFEMLGNWSFGDYFKQEQLSYYFEFLTDIVGLDPEKLYVSTFIGDPKNNLPKDSESAEIWKELFLTKGITALDVEMGSVEDGAKKGMQGARIFYYDASKNWWSRSGTPETMPEGEPGGPDSEVFYEFTDVLHDPKFGELCHPNCDCGRFLEIGNSVFMQYKKVGNGFEELPQMNVDFGGGLERTVAVSENKTDVFETDLFTPIIERICEQLNISYHQNDQTTKALRIVADHIKAATFLIKDGVTPSNKLQGYVLRRLIRRAAVKLEDLQKESMSILPKLVDPVMDIYEETEYFTDEDWDFIREVIEEEVAKFRKTINLGFKKIQKLEKIDGKTAFNLYQTYGFPIELTTEIATDKGQFIDLEEFQKEMEQHRAQSQTASAGMFKGGLVDQSEQTTKLHTATHLLQAAVKQLLGSEIGQRGSHITAERLRWDFNYPEKLTDEQISELETIVTQKINDNLPIHFDIENRDEAIAAGATTNHGETYPDNVKVYKMGTGEPYFSKELCGGPHVEQTGVLGNFKIIKQESVGAGIRRIYATIEN